MARRRRGPHRHSRGSAEREGVVREAGSPALVRRPAHHSEGLGADAGPPVLRMLAFLDHLLAVLSLDRVKALTWFMGIAKHFATCRGMREQQLLPFPACEYLHDLFVA